MAAKIWRIDYETSGGGAVVYGRGMDNMPTCNIFAKVKTPPFCSGRQHRKQSLCSLYETDKGR